MSEMEITTTKTPSIGVTMVIVTIGIDHMSLLKIVKLLLGMVDRV